MKKIVLSLINLYQKFSRKFLPKTCRFYPTCSEYTIQAIKKYGTVKGIYKGIKRIMRCNPFCDGGYDPLN